MLLSCSVLLLLFMRSMPSRSDLNMDSIDERTHGAEDYLKRWEPSEGSPDLEEQSSRSTDSVIDALVDVFQDPEMRKGAKWANGRPVFPPKKKQTKEV